MGCRGSRRPGLGVNGSHKGSKPDSERYHVSTGSSVGEWEGGKDQGFLELWAVTRDHREERAHTGVRVGLGLRRPSAGSAKHSHCGREGSSLDAREGTPFLKP